MAKAKAKAKRTCRHCGRDISHKHPNAEFCSNKGSGNCKDSYHNRDGGEREARARVFVGMSPEPDYDYDPSWDAHKYTW